VARSGNGARLQYGWVKIRAEDLMGEERAEWYRMNPQERFAESMKLMGGQACVFYGAAEFSRDLDLLITEKYQGGTIRA
jgi:hypothetical protein